MSDPMKLRVEVTTQDPHNYGKTYQELGEQVLEEFEYLLHERGAASTILRELAHAIMAVPEPTQQWQVTYSDRTGLVGQGTGRWTLQFGTLEDANNARAVLERAINVHNVSTRHKWVQR